jgi:serine protease AprX
MQIEWNETQAGYDDIMAACEEAKAAGMLIVSSCIDDIHGSEFQISGLGRYPMADPNIFESYEPGIFWAQRFYSNPGVQSIDRLLIPMDSRTTASPCGDDEFVWYSVGGFSWITPYIAGVYALAAQVNPSITPEEFWSRAIDSGRVIDIIHNDETIPLGTIIDPVALINNINNPPINKFDDVRNQDLSVYDFSGRPDLIDTLTFNQNTIWPEPAQMPPGCDPAEIMTNAMNPGLGVRSLHQQGITGSGVNVAIIDQPIVQTHPEYNGKIAAYYDAGCGGSESSMHGPAVTSLLVGENCGTAPGASVYYAAVPSWLTDAAYYADALNWIVAQNKTLPASEKIRVVSVSAQPSGPGSLYTNQETWDIAAANAQAAGVLVIDCTWENGFISLCWYDAYDPENVTKCTPGFRDGPVEVDARHIHCPTAPRTKAEVYSEGNYGYIYGGGTHRSSRPYAKNGYSWSIPYCAGVLAMGWQIQPELTGEQMVNLLFQSAYIKESGAKIINPPTFINLLLENKPAIQLSSYEFKFYADSNGPAPASQTLSISNSGLGTLNWLINETCDWLKVDPNDGTSTGLTDIDDVTLTVTDISPGIHNCQLTISDPCAINSPQVASISLYVSDANTQTIQEAIDAAEDGDTVIIEPGYYTGNGNRDLDFKGKAITVRSVDPNDPDVVASTIIVCQGSESEPHRGFYFHNNEEADSVLAGFTITQGYQSRGGGIYCEHASPTISNCVLVDNSAEYGGGMHNSYSNTNVVNCTFIGNSAVNWGGGMTNRDCTRSLTVTNCIFTDNSASCGGGMRNYTSSTTVINCTFSDNWARGWEGGGMSNRDGGNPTVINCTFCGNSSTLRGGGIYSDENSSATVSNCILWENSNEGGTDESAQIDSDGPVPLISYSCVQGWMGDLGGIGNTGANPLFADAENGDYHLKSQAGRWDVYKGRWTKDDVTSPCIDAGDPMSPIGPEPFPNGGIINMGAYGGTVEASKSYFGEPIYETIIAGDINGSITSVFGKDVKGGVKVQRLAVQNRDTADLFTPPLTGCQFIFYSNFLNIHTAGLF